MKKSILIAVLALIAFHAPVQAGQIYFFREMPLFFMYNGIAVNVENIDKITCDDFYPTAQGVKYNGEKDCDAFRKILNGCLSIKGTKDKNTSKCINHSLWDRH